MVHTIIFSPEAEDDLDALSAHDRTKALDAIDLHLVYEPTKESRSRIKRLRGYGRPQYRLRIDDLRVFYDVIYAVDEGIVEVLAIREKSEAMKWLADKGLKTDETSTTE